MFLLQEARTLTDLMKNGTVTDGAEDLKQLLILQVILTDSVQANRALLFLMIRFIFIIPGSMITEEQPV